MLPSKVWLEVAVAAVEESVALATLVSVAVAAVVSTELSVAVEISVLSVLELVSVEVSVLLVESVPVKVELLVSVELLPVKSVLLLESLPVRVELPLPMSVELKSVEEPSPRLPELLLLLLPEIGIELELELELAVGMEEIGPFEIPTDELPLSSGFAGATVQADTERPKPTTWPTLLESSLNPTA